MMRFCLLAESDIAVGFSTAGGIEKRQIRSTNEKIQYKHSIGTSSKEVATTKDVNFNNAMDVIVCCSTNNKLFICGPLVTKTIMFIKGEVKSYRYKGHLCIV